MAKLRDIFTVFVIVYMTGINFTPTAPRSIASIDIAAGNTTTQLIKGMLYLIALGILLVRWRYAVKVSLKNFLIWLILLWVLASVIWSDYPTVTLRSAVGLLGTTLIALYLATFYSFDHFALLAGWAFLIVDLLSFLVIALLPTQGINFDPYGWQGIYFTKNGLGVNSLLGIILFITLLTQRKTAALGLVGLGLSFILLIGSRSTTSLLCALVALGVWSFLRAFVRKNGLAFITLTATFLLLVLSVSWLLATSNTATLFNLLQKDASLTGRIPIWQTAWEYVRQNPWLGYGYGAVWVGNDFGIGSYISNDMKYYVVNVHNGYLDMLLEIGVIGLILVAGVLLSILSRLLLKFSRPNRAGRLAIWPVVFLVVLVVYNATEAALLVQNSIDWILIAFLGFSLT